MEKNEYLSKEYLNEVMFDCKIKGRLSEEAVRCFTLLATKVSNSNDYRNAEDKKDAINFAVADFAAYWKNYKINPMVQVKFTRSIYNGEEFTLIHGNINKTYVARLEPQEENEFRIHPKINKTIEELHNLLERDSDGSYFTTIHKVTRKLAIVDNTCHSNSNGILIVNKKVGSRISDDDPNPHVGLSRFTFSEAPPAFNFLTSVARNGLFKATKIIYSENQKQMINFSRLNRMNGGIYND